MIPCIKFVFQFFLERDFWNLRPSFWESLRGTGIFYFCLWACAELHTHDAEIKYSDIFRVFADEKILWIMTNLLLLLLSTLNEWKRENFLGLKVCQPKWITMILDWECPEIGYLVKNCLGIKLGKGKKKKARFRKCLNPLMDVLPINTLKDLNLPNEIPNAKCQWKNLFDRKKSNNLIRLLTMPKSGKSFGSI